MTVSRWFCIRHGESSANAGEATEDPLSIPLTERGRHQAEQVAREWRGAEPALIIVSPATRAQETAAPTVARFPVVPVQTWPVQEFTYLAPGRCAGTTVDERREWVKAYWLRADPHHIDGVGAESFAEFIGRVAATRESLAQLSLPAGSKVMLFGHGQFINAFRWLRTGAAALDMAAFRAFDAQNHVQNGQVLALD